MSYTRLPKQSNKHTEPKVNGKCGLNNGVSLINILTCDLKFLLKPEIYMHVLYVYLFFPWCEYVRCPIWFFQDEFVSKRCPHIQAFYCFVQIVVVVVFYSVSTILPIGVNITAQSRTELSWAISYISIAAALSSLVIF